MSKPVTSYCTFVIEDPTDLKKGYPKTTHELHVLFNRDFNDLMSDRLAPSSVNFDNAIVEMTLDKEKARELRGSMVGFTEYNCAHCGAGLSLRGCNSCGHEFKDDHFRCGWNTPLSPKMIAHLEQSGHKFVVSTDVAQKAEAIEFANRTARESERLKGMGKEPAVLSFNPELFKTDDWEKLRDSLLV